MMWCATIITRAQHKGCLALLNSNDFACLFRVIASRHKRLRRPTTIRHGGGRESRFSPAEAEYGREPVRRALVLSRYTLTAASMEVALAELALEEPQEVEEDIEFIVDKGTFFSVHSTSL